MQLLETILNLIYPQTCGICGKLSGNYLCEDCKEKLQSKKINKIIYIKDKYFEKQMYIFKYEGIIRSKLLNYKFNDKSYLYHTFAQIMIDDPAICNFIKQYDVIIPVPLHKKRKLERGYNQTELIINKVLKNINNNLQTKEQILLDTQSLSKIRNTKRQSLLNKEERITNIKDAYRLQESNKTSNLKDKKILLFDDIYTTGNTVNECAKTIKNKYNVKIGVLTISRD